MQVKELKSEGLSHELEITIPANDLDKRVEDRLIEYGKGVNIPGFRKGKVPMPILRQRYGKAMLGEIL
ncbi:MAG: trigger factor family protein, partial [Pseudomonadota bacterium]|nr:trigger factor family protein [Pseudomonadota bacterium]